MHGRGGDQNYRIMAFAKLPCRNPNPPLVTDAVGICPEIRRSAAIFAVMRTASHTSPVHRHAHAHQQPRPSRVTGSRPRRHRHRELWPAAVRRMRQARSSGWVARLPRGLSLASLTVLTFTDVLGTVTRTALPAAVNPYGCRFDLAFARHSRGPELVTDLRLCAAGPKKAPLNVLQSALDGARPIPLVRAVMPDDQTTLRARGCDLEARVARVEPAA